MRRGAGQGRDTVEKGAVPRARAGRQDYNVTLGGFLSFLGPGSPYVKCGSRERGVARVFIWEPWGRLFKLGLLLQSTLFLTTPGEAPTGRTECPEGGGWGPSEAETGLSGTSPSSHLYSAAATGPACRTSCPPTPPHPHPRKPATRLKGRTRTKQAEGAGAPHPGGTDAGPSSNPEPNGVTGTLPVEGSAEALA